MCFSGIDPETYGCRRNAKPGADGISSTPTVRLKWPTESCVPMQEDESHLLLCEAVFTLQSDRGPDFHFHLEQPIGSEMLYQECLQTIVANTFMTRCDLCTAGNLKHPINKLALQKGTQNSYHFSNHVPILRIFCDVNMNMNTHMLRDPSKIRMGYA